MHENYCRTGRPVFLIHHVGRQSLFAGNYSEANEINRAHLGKGLSQQSYAIFNKIRKIDDFLKQAPDYMNNIMESHPEICFANAKFHQEADKHSKEYFSPPSPSFPNHFWIRHLSQFPSKIYTRLLI